MKQAEKILAFVYAVCISSISYAQDEGRLEDLYLQGKWTASCATEIIDKVTIRHCELCPFIKDKSRGQIKEIEMTFQPDSVVLNQNGKLTTVPYTRNKDNHSISGWLIPPSLSPMRHSRFGDG